MAVAVAFVNNDFVVASTSNPITFTAVPTGVAAADRITVIALSMDGRNGASAVSINGIAATRAVTQSPGTDYLMCEIWYALNPTGTTANVVVTTGSDARTVYMAIGCYRLIGSAVDPSDTDANGATSSANIAISGLTIPTNGAAVYAAANGNPTTAIVWTNATESEDYSASAFRQTSASRAVAGTVTTTMDGATDTHTLCGAAWDVPAAAGGAFPWPYYHQQYS